MNKHAQTQTNIDYEQVNSKIENFIRMFEIQKQITAVMPKLKELKEKLGMRSSGDAIYEPYNIERIIESNNYDNLEKELIYAGILRKNVIVADRFFRHRCTGIQPSMLRNSAFECLLKHPEELWLLMNNHYKFNWTIAERTKVYKIYHEYFKQKFGSGIKDIYRYVIFFRNLVNIDVTELMIKRIEGRKESNMSGELLKSPHMYNLTSEHIDRLNAIVMLNKLIGRKKSSPN